MFCGNPFLKLWVAVVERNNHNCHHPYSIRNQKQEDVTLKKSISILLLFTTLVVGTSGFATEYFTIGEVLEQAGTGLLKYLANCKILCCKAGGAYN